MGEARLPRQHRAAEDRLFTPIHLLGKQSRHPARGKRRREDEAQRRARTLRGEYPPLDQCRDDAAGMALAHAHNASGIGARQLSPVEHGFEDAP